MKEKQLTIKSQLMVPKSITLNELHGTMSGSHKKSMGRDLNVVLSIGGSATSNFDDSQPQSLTYLTHERKRPTT